MSARLNTRKSVRPPRLAQKLSAAEKAAATKAASKANKAPPPPRLPSIPKLEESSPEEFLSRAMQADTPRARGQWAKRGLASRARIDKTIQSMLLRQLYLSYFEMKRYEDASEVAKQSLRLGVLLDVVHQDAARALAALGDLDTAAQHLRRAARIGPASRKAFHWWTLGSMYFLAERHEEAIAALGRAARWGTRDKPLYQGHLALAQIAAGEKVDNVVRLLQRLRAVPAGQGYGRFVLGYLAYHGKRYREAKKHFEDFITRTENARPAMMLALSPELERARETLALITRS